MVYFGAMQSKLKTVEVCPVKKFEYKVTTIATTVPITTKGYEKIVREFETKLNELGAEGWEFVQRIDSLFFFKREIE